MYGGLLLMQSKRDLLRWFVLKVKKVKYLNTGEEQWIMQFVKPNLQNGTASII